MKKHYINLAIYSLLILTILTLWSCQQKGSDPRSDHSDLSVKKVVRRANVVYDSAAFQTGYAHVPPYIANGILGGCFDHMGFQSRPEKGTPEGRTVLGYIDQYYMAENTRQIQLPLAYIQAEFADGSTILNMMEAEDYRQELDLYTGMLTTSYDLHGETKITAFAHQTIPNLFVMKIDREADSPEKELVVKIHCETSASQNADIKWKAEPVKLDFDLQGKRIDVTSRTNLSTTHWSVVSNNNISQKGNEIRIRLKEKENLIKLRVKRDDVNKKDALGQSYENLKQSHIKKWKEEWAKSWISFPTERAHNIWTRANYYNLSNFPVIPEKALIPTGMNTNIWGFTFPQDVYYVVENLTRTNHFDRYKKSMQYWLDILPEVKKYSRRIMEVKGGYYPWTPPFTEWDEFEKNGVVSEDSYELHNPAYVSAMVWHYYQCTGDEAFLQKYFPIMEEVWRFYTNVLHKNNKGTYDIMHHKATGQDEASRLSGAKNLLGASYSAEYAARNYLKATKKMDECERALEKKAEAVLEAGLERESLMKKADYYGTYEGDHRPPNKQKHPVQLNPITFVPMNDLVTKGSPVVKAWNNRYDLTTQAKKPVTHGWTYATLALSSSRMRSPSAFSKELSAIQYYAGADPRWIQFYEYTFWERYTLNLAYYFPTHGLYQQAFTDAVIQDWRGYIDLFPALLKRWEKDPLVFKGLTLRGGIKAEGKWDKGNFKVTLNPGNKEEFKLRVSRDIENIHANGQKKGPDTFAGNQLVSFTFNGEKPIMITHNITD